MKPSFLTLMLLLSIPVFFTGCAEDMYEDSTSLEDLYRQKAAEFSRKYGVEVTLNEEKISEIVATKTLYDLENDIRALASLNICLHEVQETSSPRHRMRILRKKRLSEQNEIRSGKFSVIGSINVHSSVDSVNSYLYNFVNGECRGSVSWTYGNYSSLTNSVSVSVSPVHSTTNITFSINNCDFTYSEALNDITVNSTSTLTLAIDYYYVNNVNCSIVHTAGINEGQIYIQTPSFSNFGNNRQEEEEENEEKSK